MVRQSLRSYVGGEDATGGGVARFLREASTANAANRCKDVEPKRVGGRQETAAVGEQDREDEQDGPHEVIR